MRSGRLLPSIVVLSVAAGCASARLAVSRSSLLQDGWQPAESQECATMNEPLVLPSADVVMEVSGLSNVLGSGAAGLDRASPYAVFELMYDSVGGRQGLRVVEAEADSVALRELSSLFFPEIRGEPPSRARSWGVLVRVASRNRETLVTVGRMEYCACALINRAEVTRLLTWLTRETRIPGVTGRRQVTLQVRSDSTGAILEKRLTQSTGNMQLDRMIYDLTDSMKVAPALLNRRPLNGWSRLPITLNFPAR